MNSVRTVRIALSTALCFVCLVLSSAACRDDTTTAPGALANVMFEAPDSARSGESVLVDVRAANVGINNIHNGRVDVTLQAPLRVDSVDASDGSATFSNGAVGGATVTWMLGTLDSNSQSRLHIHTTGTLLGTSATFVTLRATLTADGVRAGDAVAEKTLQLTP
jgi:hypothetical protein